MVLSGGDKWFLVGGDVCDWFLFDVLCGDLLWVYVGIWFCDFDFGVENWSLFIVGFKEVLEIYEFCFFLSLCCD